MASNFNVMLFAFIGIYILLTLWIGIWSSRLVKNSTDFILASHRLPLFMATSTVFATWFGSETVLGASAQMSEYGLLGVIEDPFGASLCLILIGLFFARPLYRMNLISFGDFYKVRFGKTAEFIAALCLIISYFGWIAAQMVALGIVLNTVSGIGINTGILFSSIVVILYTYMGGMWAVSVTDFIQTIVIIAGIILATVYVTNEAGGIGQVIGETPPHYFQFFPQPGITNWLEYIAAWITLGLGSIPQQDVYQRVMASRSEKIAVYSSLLAGFMYLTIALFPLLLGLAAKQLFPGEENTQYLLPQLILEKTNLLIQVLFFGALISAIMSTASGALLAPSVILSENILRPRMKKITDKQFLAITRMSIVVIAVISLGMALSRKDIYELVGEASAISLVSLFVPLVAGLFFKVRNEAAVILSMLSGILVWFVTSHLPPPIPPILLGLFASIAGLLLGRILFRRRERSISPSLSCLSRQNEEPEQTTPSREHLK